MLHITGDAGVLIQSRPNPNGYTVIYKAIKKTCLYYRKDYQDKRGSKYFLTLTECDKWIQTNLKNSITAYRWDICDIDTDKIILSDYTYYVAEYDYSSSSEEYSEEEPEEKAEEKAGKKAEEKAGEKAGEREAGEREAGEEYEEGCYDDDERVIENWGLRI